VGDEKAQKSKIICNLRKKEIWGGTCIIQKSWMVKKVGKLGHTTESKRRKDKSKLCKKKYRIRDDGRKGSHWLLMRGAMSN
jgi:hypothetical protein